MACDTVRPNGRGLLLAEELALLLIGERGGPFPGGPVPDAALAAAILIELRARAMVDIEGGFVRLVDRWTTGDPVLDEIVFELQRSRPRTVRLELVTIARTGIATTIAERLRRQGIVAREQRAIFGVIPIWHYSVTSPRLLTHWMIRIHAIVRGEETPDAREHALLPLLAALGLLPRLVDQGERRTAAAVVSALGPDDPILGALRTQVALVETREDALVPATA